jgi:galactose mutarotase-like enzyme
VENMYQVISYTENEIQYYKLMDLHTNSYVVVYPERGGIILQYNINGEDLLFLNEKTVKNPEENIRGGIPILFPICGQLKNDEYILNEKTYKMKNHGCARNYPWEVLGTDSENGASIILRLVSNEETKEIYPFDFGLTFEYKLVDGKLTINQTYLNKSNTTMLMYSGFHPYFNITNKELNFEVNADEYLDYQDQQIKLLEGNTIDFSSRNEAVLLLDVKDNHIVFPLGDKKVKLEFGDEFKHIALWSQVGESFICIEPWMGKMNDMNDLAQVRLLEQGESLNTEISISVV